MKRTLFELRRRLQVALCCQIPSRFWRTVKFPHPIGIVIGDGTVIGCDVRIYQNVTIGLTENVARCAAANYPTIEDAVCIYAGAVIFGGITVGARSVIGANAVVSCSVPPDSVVFGYNQVRARTARSDGYTAQPEIAVA
jgi:serine O-acetyltransferase